MTEMHVARLLVITELSNVPPDIRPFVEFRAGIEERDLQEDEKVALLVIETTSCYVPVFLRDPPTMDTLVKQLADQDAQLTSDSKAVLAKHLK